MRRATKVHGDAAHPYTISIHALHEESDIHASATYADDHISIHALHEESDALSISTLTSIPISIHALHEESDL